LKLADNLPLTENNSINAIQPWIKRVEQLSGGKVKIQHFPAEQLGKAKDMITIAQTGIADISLPAPAYVGTMS